MSDRTSATTRAQHPGEQKRMLRFGHTFNCDRDERSMMNDERIQGSV
jgi:hypothetical protein